MIYALATFPDFLLCRKGREGGQIEEDLGMCRGPRVSTAHVTRRSAAAPPDIIASAEHSP